MNVAQTSHTKGNLMTIAEIITAIQAVEKDAELRVLSSALREQFTHVEQVATLSFRRGQRVSFKSKQKGRLEGVIIKINRTSIAVDVGSGRTWRVAPTLLERIV